MNNVMLTFLFYSWHVREISFNEVEDQVFFSFDNQQQGNEDKML